tara:strand:- start:255599 stop:256246 length:648 start_codon:yes stop_codon:yes gene_type:complete
MHFLLLSIKKTKYIFSFLILIFFLSCNIDNNHDIFVDNPKEEDIKLKIDGNEYDIPAFGFLELNIKSGTYKISATIDDSCFFKENIIISKSGLLNIHKETYVLWSDLYTTTNLKPKQNQLQLRNIKINKNLYKNVDFIIYQNLNFIPKAWHFSVNESWEENLNYYFLDSQVKSKIYRLVDLEKEFGFGPPPDLTGYTIDELRYKLNELETHGSYD